MENQGTKTVKIVGRGAYGVVYLCLDKDGRHFITKHIPVSDMTPTERQSAMNEVCYNFYSWISWCLRLTSSLADFELCRVVAC